MSIGEVSSINASASYQGQGSSVKAPVLTESVAKDITKSENDKASSQNTAATITSINNKADNAKQKDSEPREATSSLREAVSKINAASQSCEAVFGIHEETNRVMIKMVDKDTKEVIKEFPAEETLDLIAKAWDLAGIMVDEKR